jgi:hypothetical protein
VPAHITIRPSLPRRISAPSVFSGHSPIGSASVAFSSSQWQFDGTIDTIALTGSSSPLPDWRCYW